MNNIINITPETKNQIVKLNNEQLAQLYFVGTRPISECLEIARDELIKRGLNKIEFIDPLTMHKKELSISYGQTTTKEIKNKIINWDKVIEYANSNNIKVRGSKLDWKEESPLKLKEQGYNIDFSWIEGEMWFQEKIKEFIEEKIEIKTSNSNTSIRINDAK